MKPRISVLTLAVADLEKSLAFYSDGSGLPSQGIVGREFEHGAVAFFDLAGAEIVKPAQDTFYGDYAGYFRDPNGHCGRWFGIRCSCQRSSEAVVGPAL